MTDNIISIKNLSKTFKSGHKALLDVNLDIRRGEILALLGSNGAGKTTLISCICGIMNPTSGTVSVDGMDIITDFKSTRSLIGLVPQELTLGLFDNVFDTVSFSRGLFNMKKNRPFITQLLADLSLSDKINSQIRSLSGGMKRRVLIAKALAHEPKILFLDEPTAGVDVELRKAMWEIISELKANGVTIILTTHYIEEAESIADRIAIIENGSIKLIEKTTTLLEQLGTKHLDIIVSNELTTLPDALSKYNLISHPTTKTIQYIYSPNDDTNHLSTLLNELYQANITVLDIQSNTSSLEDIFVNLIKKND